MGSKNKIEPQHVHAILVGVELNIYEVFQLYIPSVSFISSWKSCS